jgi:hypothetical protein
MRERRGKPGLYRKERLRTDPARRFELLGGDVFRADTDWPPAAGPSRQLGQSIEGRLRPSEMIDEFPECDRADILGADQPQAGKALCVVERRNGQRSSPG